MCHCPSSAVTWRPLSAGSSVKLAQRGPHVVMMLRLGPHAVRTRECLRVAKMECPVYFWASSVQHRHVVKLKLVCQVCCGVKSADEASVATALLCDGDADADDDHHHRHGDGDGDALDHALGRIPRDGGGGGVHHHHGDGDGDALDHALGKIPHGDGDGGALDHVLERIPRDGDGDRDGVHAARAVKIPSFLHVGSVEIYQNFWLRVWQTEQTLKTCSLA
mmetsp:Transcript_123013/g.225622  ORF Transcript_123013/g.225622 Transcript_123013/m.225622 type:complete len:220 (-) Transcript_123013:332-991(-)